MGKTYYVYILASKTRVLYIGFTNNLIRRISEHRMNVVEGFSKKYKCKKLVYSEFYNDVNKAIAREKQLKRWRRDKKIMLIESVNPDWKDIGID
jgi:putative endonuclease